VIARKKLVTRYYVERTLYMRPAEHFDKEIYVQRKTFAVKRCAYEWVARASVFRRRTERNCPCMPHPEDGTCMCRYCNEDKWRPMVTRLARILAARDTHEEKATEAVT
jgi:hypothetical protein